MTQMMRSLLLQMMAPSQEQNVALSQDSAAMHKCLAELPEQQKIYLEMAFFEGLTHQALSDRTGLL